MKGLLSVVALFICVSFTLEAYSRDGAVAYARKWALGANHKCGTYSSCTPASYWGSEVCGYASQGGDCAGDCLKEKGWKSTCGLNQKPPSGLKVGDVLIYHAGSCDSYTAHATIVTTAGATPKISCHSSNKLDVAYTYMGSSKPYLQWLQYQG